MTNLNKGNGWKKSTKHNKCTLMGWLRNLFSARFVKYVLRIHTSTVDTFDSRNLESAKSKEMELQLSADWLTTVDMPAFSSSLSLSFSFSLLYIFYLSLPVFLSSARSIGRLLDFVWKFCLFLSSLSLRLLLLLIRTGAVGKINKRNNTWAKQICRSFNDVDKTREKREKRERRTTRSLLIWMSTVWTFAD